MKKLRLNFMGLILCPPLGTSAAALQAEWSLSVKTLSLFLLIKFALYASSKQNFTGFKIM